MSSKVIFPLLSRSKMRWYEAISVAVGWNSLFMALQRSINILPAVIVSKTPSLLSSYISNSFLRKKQQYFVSSVHRYLLKRPPFSIFTTWSWQQRESPKLWLYISDKIIQFEPHSSFKSISHDHIIIDCYFCGEMVCKADVDYFEGNQIVMGASCVGKGNRPEPKKSDNKSNTLSSEMQSSEDVVLHRTKDIRLPSLVLTPHQPVLCPMPIAFRIPPEKQAFHKEYRYQELFEFRTQKKFVSSCSIAEFTQKRQQQLSKEEKWSQCSTLERDMYDLSTVVILNGCTYIASAPIPQQLQQKSNKIPQLSEGEIEIKLVAQVYPKKLLLISIRTDDDGAMKIDQKCYEIEQSVDIQIIAKEIVEMHPNFEYFHTPFLNGVTFSHQQEGNSQFQPHFLAQLFGIKQNTAMSSVFMFYTNEMKPQSSRPEYKIKGKLSKYFEIANYVKESYGDIWHCSLIDLEIIVQSQKLDGYLAIQFLRCIIDSLERRFFKSGKYMDKREDLNQERAKIIQQFLILDQHAIRLMNFLIKVFFIFQGASLQEADDRMAKIEKSIVCQLTTICDGLFHEFGYEINEKEHFFKLEGYCFVKFKNQKKQIRHINKNVQYPHPAIINRIKYYLLDICTSNNLQKELIDTIRKDFMKQLEQNQKQIMSHRINLLFVEDFFLRLKLLQFYLSILQSKMMESQWKELQDHISLIEFVTPQTTLFYLTLGGLASTAFKPNIQRTQAEQFYYLKALELAHKIYGDPRANRSSMPIESQQAWQLLILQNYSSLFKGTFEKKEFHYLNNISECLRQDLKSFFPDPQFSQEESYQKNLTRMIQYLPIKTISGLFYLRPSVFDSENEELRSNYSQSLSSSSSSKRTNRVSYKINESQFSLKLSLYSGIIRWGHNIAGPPHILPPFKNKQVISISSGNYHTIFLTEGGVFGWGENHSSQLGDHNKQKVYLKETVCVKSMSINRHKDRFQISCGNEHSAVLINGLLYMWGQSEGGILGGHGHVFDMISCGGLHTLAIREGVVYSWGRGEGGQLGHPLNALTQKKKEETTEFFIDVPTAIQSIPASVIKIACGDAHSLVLTSEGRVFVFGFCYQGQLGLGLTGQNQTFQVFEPLEQSFFKERIIDIFAGPTFSFFKTERQEVYSCGMNDCLQLGIDRVLKVFQKKKYLNRTVQLNRRKLGEQQFSRPRRIDMFGGQFGVSLMQLECGQNHCLALVRYMGQEVMLMGWGLNRHFQIETALPQSTTPRTLDTFYSIPITHICCGATYSLANIGSILMTDQELQLLLFEAHAQGNCL